MAMLLKANNNHNNHNNNKTHHTRQTLLTQNLHLIPETSRANRATNTPSILKDAKTQVADVITPNKQAAIESTTTYCDKATTHLHKLVETIIVKVTTIITSTKATTTVVLKATTTTGVATKVNNKVKDSSDNKITRMVIANMTTIESVRVHRHVIDRPSATNAHEPTHDHPADHPITTNPPAIRPVATLDHHHPTESTVPTRTTN
jgi:hypothetical protein